MSTATGHHPHPAVQRKPLPIGVIDHHKMAKMFHSVAWAIVTAQNSHQVEASGLADDIASQFVGLVWHPTVKTVETSPNPQFDHNVEVIAHDFMVTFLKTLHQRGYDQAQLYAQQVHSRQNAALNTIRAKLDDARSHNADLAHKATMGMTIASDTIFVCEIAIAVGVCVLSFGAAPALLGGATMSGTAQAVGGMLISEGYGIASTVVNNASSGKSQGFAKDAKAWAVSNEVKISHSTGGMGAALTGGNYALTRQMEALDKLVWRANAEIRAINAELGQQISALRRGRLNDLKFNQQMTKVNAMNAKDPLEKAARGMDHAGKGLAIVQLGADLWNAFAALHERQVEIAH